MKSFSITRLRREIFSIIEDVGEGESVEVTRNGVPVAIINPIDRSVWRDRLKIIPKLLMDVEDAFAPLDEEWEPYI